MLSIGENLCANEMDPAFFPHKPHTSNMGMIESATHTHRREGRSGCMHVTV